jgi:WD40 repeat protein/serine/threonine protein kinase
MTLPCPPRSQVERLLADQLDPAEDAALTRHVEACASCQALLEELSGDRLAPMKPVPPAEDDRPASSAVPETPTVLGGPEAAVEGVIDRLKERPPDPSPAVPSGESGQEERAAPPALPQIPGYEVLEEVGRGGMGVIYRARHLGLNRIVALKTVRSGVQTNAIALARLRAEASAVARLHHPNIVQIYEVGEYAGQPYLALEFVAGGSLRDHLDGTPRLARAAAGFVEVVARAMDAAHARGIVHRDLKPANILLDWDLSGRAEFARETSPSALPTIVGPSAIEKAVPKITDFGLAKWLDAAEAGEPLTQTGEVVGTPSYMAPEQARASGAAVGPPADVYALGAVLYELLTGRAPFVGQTTFETLLRVVHEEPVSVTRLCPWVPRDLATVTMKCLEKEPARRYASALQLADDLRRFQGDEPIAARPPSAWYRGRKFVRRHKALVVGLGGTLAAMLLGTVVSVLFALGEAKERRLADAKTAEAQANLYAARMNLVQASWQDGQLRRVLDLLQACSPAGPEDRDLRGWEWRHQWRLCHDELRTIGEHTDEFVSVAFSPDGTRLAAASPDGTAHVWDVASGRSRVLRGHRRGISCIAFSPDGTRLATGSTDHSIKVWDVAEGRELHALKGHIFKVEAVAFSPDGRWLASLSRDQTVRVWDAATGRTRHVLPGHTAQVRGVAFSPDGRWLASGSSDFTVLIWDWAREQPVHRLRGHAQDVEGLAFSPDGRWLASASLDRTVRLWDAATGRERHTLRGHANWVYNVAFSPDGRLLASAGWDGTVKVWDVASGQDLRTIRGHTTRVHGVAFSPDGAQLATASADHTVKLWDAGGEEFRPFRGITAQVEALAFSPDGQRLASASGANVTVWDAAAGVVLTTLHAQGDVLGVAFSPDGTRLASAGADGTVCLWAAAGGRALQVLRGHRGRVRAVAFSPDGERLASAGEDRVVRLWDARSGRELAALQGHAWGIAAVVFSPDGRWLASGGGEENKHGETYVWDAKDGRPLRTVRSDAGDVRALAVSPDGRWLATAMGVVEQQGEIQLWDAADGRAVRTLRGHGHVITGLAFSPDGGRLASAGYDHVVKLWDPATGQELRTLAGQRRFLCVAFSPDGTLLATGSQDNSITHESTVKVWDSRPPNDELRAEREALAIVDFLFARPLRRADVQEHLRGAAVLSRAARQRALALAERYPEETEPEQYHQAGWAVVCRPYLNAVQYRFALRQAEAACHLRPGEKRYRMALGAAQYRAGDYAAAQHTLGEAGPLTAAGLALVAMTQQRLGQGQQARATLAGLKEISPKHEGAKAEEVESLRRELEALLTGTAN